MLIFEMGLQQEEPILLNRCYSKSIVKDKALTEKR